MVEPMRRNKEAPLEHLGLPLRVIIIIKENINLRVYIQACCG